LSGREKRRRENKKQGKERAGFSLCRGYFCRKKGKKGGEKDPEKKGRGRKKGLGSAKSAIPSGKEREEEERNGKRGLGRKGGGHLKVGLLQRDRGKRVERDERRQFGTSRGKRDEKERKTPCRLFLSRGKGGGRGGGRGGSEEKEKEGREHESEDHLTPLLCYKKKGGRTRTP